MNIWHKQLRCAAFEGHIELVSGPLEHVVTRAKDVLDANELASILIFDDESSEVVEVDFRGSLQNILARIPEPMAEEGKSEPTVEQPRGRGRPKLGVVAREVTLLPQHWEYLNGQPGGASVALRKLVEEARRVNAGKDRLRIAREAAYRFLSAMAGNFSDFEEATRALFAGDAAGFRQSTENWPKDIRDHARRLATRVFRPEKEAA